MDCIVKKYFGGYPFLLGLAPIDSRNTEGITFSKRAIFCRVPKRYGLYLYPDSLKNWFFLFAIIMSVASTFIGSVWWFLIFSFGYYLGFILLYHKIKLLCLPNVISKLPYRLEEWILGYFERIDILDDDISLLKRSQNLADIRLRTMLSLRGEVLSKLRTKKDRRYIKLLGTYHPQEWLLRYAITDFFQARESHTPNIRLKVLFYWGAPVWIGYCLLFFPLSSLVFYENNNVSSGGLFATLLVWALLSTFFAFNQTKAVAPSVFPKFSRSELDYLPLFFQPGLANTNKNSPDYKYYGEMYRKWIAIINFSTFAIFVFLLKLAAP